jgi:hypothetical protein
MQGVGIVVTDAGGNPVVVDLLPMPSNASLSNAVFPVTIPAAGFNSYFIEYSDAKPAPAQISTGNTISNSFFELTFDEATGRLSSIVNVASGVSTNVRSVLFILDQYLYVLYAGLSDFSMVQRKCRKHNLRRQPNPGIVYKSTFKTSYSNNSGIGSLHIPAKLY